MKKILTIFALIFSLSISSFAQTNLHIGQLASSKQIAATKIMVESTSCTDNSVTYALLSDEFSNVGNFTYAQLFTERKFWEAPVFMHVEFRTYNFGYTIVYLGAAYDIFTSHGMIAIEPLYRNNSLNLYQNQHWDWNCSSLQMSIVTGHNWGWCNLSSFTDLWTESASGGGAGWYSELWYYIPITKKLQLGTITSLSKEQNTKFAYNIYLGVKINL